MENLAGKYALITGGSRGLGKATAIALANEGVHVAITGRNEQNLQVTVEAIKKLGVRATYAVFDISNYQEVNKAVAKLTNDFGEFDILVNNAGIASFGSVLDMDPMRWTEIIQTNVLGTYYLTHSVLPQLIKKKSRRYYQYFLYRGNQRSRNYLSL